MEWTIEVIDKLTFAFEEKYKAICDENLNLDFKGRSAIWNKYIKNYDCKLIRNDEFVGSSTVRGREVVCKNLIRLINLKNHLVADALVIENPDRIGQYLLISRDMASRILAMGMI